jgi:hypothetical protein
MLGQQRADLIFEKLQPFGHLLRVIGGDSCGSSCASGFCGETGTAQTEQG